MERIISSPEGEVRKARHNLRGRLNAVKLCISALEILETPQEKVEFLEMIEEAAENTITALNHLESLHDSSGAV